MKKTSIALIGCGRIGFLLEDDPLRYHPCTHYGGLVSAGLKVTHACDINKKRLKLFSSRASIPAEQCFIKYQDLFKSVHPEMVIIATWTDSHKDIACMAAKNGARVIVLEKPIASSLLQARKICDTCDSMGVKLIINHERRYDSRYITVKNLIDQKRIGEIKTVHASMLTRDYRGESRLSEGGGPLLHDGTHLVDILRYFFGEIKDIRGKFTRKNRKHGYEDHALGWFSSESGIEIFLEAGGGYDFFHFDIRICGTKGQIHIGNGYEHIYMNTPSKLYKGFRDLKEKKFPVYSDKKSFTRLYEESKKILKGKIQFPASSGMDGYKALEVIHSVYLSSFKNISTIKLPVSPSSINLKRIFNLK